MPVAAPERVKWSEPDLSLEHLFPTSITITRTSEDDWKSRQLVASVDGRQVAELMWGDSVMVELEPGAHVLRVHNTLVWRTVRFVLAPGEQVFYEAVNYASASTYFFLPVLGIGPLYVALRKMG